MSKKKILFQLNYIYHLPAVEPIIQLFANDPNYEVAYQINLEFKYRFGIFRKKVDQVEYKKFFPQNVRSIEKNEHFDFVVGTDVVDNSKFIYDYSSIVYHGPTFNKTVTYREFRKHSNEKYIIFAESDFTKQQLIDSNSIDKSIIEVVGFPKMDPYLNNSFDRKQILKNLGLDIEKKTILYAPTYKPTSIYDLSDEIFEATENYNLIIKLHHYSWMGKYASRSQSRIFTDKLNYYKHAILIPRKDYNIVPLYSVSDTLISEASGALTEFLLTGKVGIIYSLDEKVIKRSNSEPLLSNNNELLKDIYIQITSPDDLGTALEKALAPDDNRLELVEQYKNKYFSINDGNSSNRIKAYIDNMLL